MMTPQEALEIVARHLAGQEYRAVDPGGLCVYRLRGGPGCPVGALIPDREFEAANADDAPYRVRHGTDFNGNCPARFLPRYVPSLAHLDGQFLADMQEVHDYSRNWGDRGFAAWEALEAVARKHDLKPACVAEARGLQKTAAAIVDWVGTLQFTGHQPPSKVPRKASCSTTTARPPAVRG